MIRVNGQDLILPDPSTIRQLLTSLDLAEKSVAVAVNNFCIKRGEYESFILKAGDQVEVLSPMTGG